MIRQIIHINEDKCKGDSASAFYGDAASCAGRPIPIESMASAD